jgi:hypothetical protein
MKTLRSKSSLHIITILGLLISLIGGGVIVTRAHAASFTVSTLNDDGAGSLRQAIIAANAAPTTDTVTFSLSGTITLVTTLPHITDTAGLTLDGSGQTLTIRGDHKVPVLQVETGATLNLNLLTIADGKTTSGSDGGGIINNAGTLIVTNSTFSGNSADRFGGGIFNNDGTATITNSTFSGNSAAQGGGIFNYLGTLNVMNSTFTLNTSTDAGGGIGNQNGTATIANSTFSGNSATSVGGAVLGLGNEITTITILNSTLSGNSAGLYGGGIRISGGTTTLRNTIVANNTSGISGGNCSGFPINGGNNMDDGISCGWGAASGSSSTTNPALGALTGSPAYYPLLAGSPAIDAGNAAVCEAAPVSNTSQNGLTRPQGLHCDIGSYEAPDTTVWFTIFLPLILR